MGIKDWFKKEKKPIPKEEFKYSIFTDKAYRENLFFNVKELSEYIMTHNISNLIFVDKRARLTYVGVKEYLKIKYPEKTDLNIYFINPLGLAPREDISANKVNNSEYNAYGHPKKRDEIFQEFEETYQELLKNKDKKTLIFDICTHSGFTLSRVKNVLDKYFDPANLEIGVFDFVGNNEKCFKQESTPDFYVTKEDKNCHIFKAEKWPIVNNEFGKVTSMPRNSARYNKEISRQIRSEIKQTIQEFIKTE